MYKTTVQHWMKFSVASLLLCVTLLWGGVPVEKAWAAQGYGAVSGYAPKNYQNNYVYGEGVYFAPYEINIYNEPNDEAKIVESFRWGHGNGSSALMSQVREAIVPVEQVFVSFFPTLDVAMMSVVSDDGNGWVEVVYDHAKKKTGWVRLHDAAPRNTEEQVESNNSEAPQAEAPRAKTEAKQPMHFGKFQTWQDFMRLNARANGIYWLTGVSQYNRMIRTKPEDGAKTIPITVMRNMKVKHVRGNWMLVEVVDFENQTPLGWVRWRDDEGRLMVFTNFSGKKPPIMNAMY